MTFYTHTQGGREGGREQGQVATNNNRKTGANNKGTEQVGEHTTSRQNKGERKVWRVGEKARETQLGRQNSKSANPTARSVKEDSKGKEQTHSWIPVTCSSIK